MAVNVTKQPAKLTEIIGSIDELGSRGKIPRSRAFGAWFAINFFHLDEDDALEAAAADGGNDQGLDIVFSDDTSQELVVIQAHCPETFDKKTPIAKWNSAITSLPYIQKPELLSKQGRPDIAETISSVTKLHPEYGLSVGLISLGTRSPEIEASLKAHMTSSLNQHVNFFYYSQEDILSSYRALVESEGGISEDDLHFSGAHFEDAGEYGRAWVGSVSAEELKRLHSSHKDKLFAGNIRLFLGSRKGGINEQIIRTAKSSPGNFWALNNGITIVADYATFSTTEQGTSSLKLKRFSIVNGCQTTSSLVQADASNSAKVLARVIAAKSGLKNEIVRYNNSQNAVKIWTVRAVDDVQEQLRREFNTTKINYAPKQSGARKRKDESIIELDKVTQYLASSGSQFLLQSIDNKSELFDQPYQKIFKKGIKAPEVYLAWLAGGMADQERQDLIDGLNDDDNSGLLSVSSTYWIVFVCYKLLEKFGNCDSPHVKLEKMNTPEFKNALRKYIKKGATMYFDVAVDTYERETYGSFKATLRSSKFLSRFDSKINLRVPKIPAKELPDLSATCRSIKLS